MEDRNPRVEVRSQAIDQRHRQSNLRDQDQRAASGVQGRPDDLDVDRRLARPGDAVEQEWPRVPGADRGPNPRHGLGLGRQQIARRGPTSAPTDGPGGEGATRPLPDVRLTETPADESAHGRGAVPVPEVRSSQLAGRTCGQLGEDLGLAWSDGSPGRPIAGFDQRRHSPTLRAQPDPACVAGTGAGETERVQAEQEPFAGADQQVMHERRQAGQAGELGQPEIARLEGGDGQDGRGHPDAHAHRAKPLEAVRSGLLDRTIGQAGQTGRLGEVGALTGAHGPDARALDGGAVAEDLQLERFDGSPPLGGEHHLPVTLDGARVVPAQDPGDDQGEERGEPQPAHTVSS